MHSFLAVTRLYWMQACHCCWGQPASLSKVLHLLTHSDWMPATNSESACLSLRRQTLMQVIASQCRQQTAPGTV